MRITFILPEIRMSGGVKAVFEFANGLVKLGHDVFIVYPLFPTEKTKLTTIAKKGLINLKQGVKPDWFNLKANLIRVPTLAQRYIPDADIVVATWWETAYRVSQYPESKGEKFYLAQHYETWGGPEERVKRSYKLGLRIIVNSTWLKNILQDELNIKSEALILHAPDWDDFYPENTEKNKEVVRILMPYRNQEWKGVEDGIKAFELAREKFPNIKLVMFGPKPGKNMPSYAEYHKRPSNAQLRRIYNLSDIFVFPSWYEGFGMPPAEAMACKIAVATTRVGAIPDYVISGKTALVSEPKDINSLAKNIIELIENKNKREEIAKNGHNHIKQFTWDRATDQLEKVFRAYTK